MVELRVYTIKPCGVCALLIERIHVNTMTNEAGVRDSVLIKVINSDDNSDEIAPRIKRFPTVIAYKNGIPRLGWEGFAAMAPEEIQDAMVLDVLQQAAALADEPDELAGDISAAGAARSDAGGGAP